MRTIALAAAAMVTLSFASIDAQAGAWCAYYNRGTNCGFQTFAQCLATVSGIGGYCNRSPSYQAYGGDYGRRSRGGQY